MTADLAARLEAASEGSRSAARREQYRFVDRLVLIGSTQWAQITAWS